MEGKAVLFKKFAGIDSFDIEVEERDPDKLVEIVAALEPTFGAINLEDIRAPDCFIVESKLRERMKIPVFHDDQHGTAIIVAAAVRNGLFLMGKPIEEARLVASGAGAASLACLNLLVGLGMKLENILVTDIDGVVYEGRPTLMDPWKAKYARATSLRTLAEAIEGADIFLGLSAAGVLKPEMVAKMAAKPLILALANPDARDPARARARSASRCDHRHRPQRLSEPGQQRPVLPVHFQGRPRRGRHHHQRGDEARLRRRAGTARPRAAARDRDRCLRRRRAAFRVRTI